VGLKFTWNKGKASANLAKHGVSFEEAATVFADPLSLTISDPDHSADETRFLIVGHSLYGHLLVVSHVERADTIRIISARPATRRERVTYEQE